jgi:N-acetylglucosaminyldiphosphoundecaprenol N-acetyl-beta-D-mannosaminyltransferase
MQERGLEWTYRIAQEPKRLLPRYLVTNPSFMLNFARQWLREHAEAPHS